MDDLVNAAGAASGAGAAGAKLAGLMAPIATFMGGAFMFILTMAFQPPKTIKETVLAFSCLIVCGFCGGAFIEFYFNLSIPATFQGHCIKFGIAMPCAAIGWLAIKGWFSWSEKYGLESVADIINKLVKK